MSLFFWQKLCYTFNKSSYEKYNLLYCYGNDVLIDLKELTVGERYNVDEMMQDIEILRYE